MTAPGVTRLTNQDEILLRQVHPSWLVDGAPTKAAFHPTSKDEKKLSTLREAVGAEEAYRRWTVALKRASVGTYGIAVAEVNATTFERASDQIAVGLLAVDDAVTQGVPDHASVVFTDLSKEQRVQAARKLREHAVARGSLHP